MLISLSILRNRRPINRSDIDILIFGILQSIDGNSSYVFLEVLLPFGLEWGTHPDLHFMTLYDGLEKNNLFKACR
jgi:hypothetical protein